MSLGAMSAKNRGNYKVRVSTVFLLLSLFCLTLEFIPSSSLIGGLGDAIKELSQIPWIALVFGQFGPLWAAIGAVFALIGIAFNFKKTRIVVQSLVEILLCAIAFILFPVY